jgi:hypothetical protein
MSHQAVEILLAKLYTDERFRREFNADPRATALREGLDENEAASVASMDPSGIELAAESYAHKRDSRKPQSQTRRGR